MVDSLLGEAFPAMRQYWRKIPEARSTVMWLKEHGYDVVIATGMLFPRFVIEMKLEWAGVPSSEFEYLFITDWENMHTNKPLPEYFVEVLDHVGRAPDQCLMVGDSWEHDVVPARTVGLPVYWIADKDEEKPDPSIHLVGQGNLSDLLTLIQIQSA